ncbi:NAD-dependent epimerase/dehydratase family protein [Bacteroides sp.]|uniref:NAD-dependent epimerase/dehydratase family protein n=1 Tax=Bacteroides sp. TaxID=29523 RepID=UPI0026106BBA|nr:NAD-dependent epimerase/dehydratase family protein [Bacteroides sp.]MDD3040458.1 NAD-dependent epimerase/dehydratase family protein [Bacteroides sp.]
MNILITGIHGFVGSNLVKALGAKHAVYGLDIVAPSKAGVVKTFNWKDLEENRLPVMDVVIHLAGKAHDTKNQSLAQAYFDINEGLTKKVFNYFLKSKAGKFIFFSSVKAAADSVPGDILTEEVVPAPVGPYGESKIAAEDYIQDNFDLEGTDDKLVYILRPCMIHGPGNKGNLNLLYKVVSKGIPWPLGAFDNRRSFTSVDNLCFVIDGLVAGMVPSGIYHMGDDEPISTNELIGVMCESLGRKAHIWNLPRELMQGIASLGGVLQLPLNSQRLNKLTENYVVSNAKIKGALGIDRMPVSAREGLLITLNSFKEKV